MKAVVGAYLALAVAFALVNPEFEAPDEHTHFFFAQHLGRGGGLPVQPLVPDERGPWEQEGSQPPLYYGMAAPLTVVGSGVGAPTEAGDLWFNHQNSMGHPEVKGNENRFVHPRPRSPTDVFLVRLFSIALGLVTVVATWLVAGYAFPARPHLAVAAAGVAGLTPQFAYLSGSVTNDALVIALGTLALALVLRVANEGPDARTVLALVVVVGLAPLAKLSGLAVAGFAVLSVLGVAYRRGDPRLVWRVAAPASLAAAAFSGWWYVRNYVLYGEPTGISRMLPGAMRRDFELASWLAGLPAELVGLWRSFWGLFGWFTLPMPGWAYAAIDLVVAAALAGLALGAVRRVAFVRWRVVGWLGLWLVVVMASLLRWMTIAKGAQGRLLFPALAAVAVLLVAGLRVVLPARISDRALGAGVGAGLAALSVFALLGVVRPAYAKPAAVAEVPAGAQAAGAVWADWLPDPGAGRQLVLEAVEVPERVGAAESLEATLYWRSNRALSGSGAEGSRDESPAFGPAGGPGDAFVATRLDVVAMPAPSTLSNPASEGTAGGVRADGPVSGPVELAYPGSGALPPSLMEPGVVYADRRRVPAPRTDAPLTQPRAERLSVHLFGPEPDPAADPHDQRPMYRWPLAGSDNGEWSTFVVREPDRPAGPPARDPDARFDGGIELWIQWAGHSSNSAEFSPFWAATAPVHRDLSAFVHVLDSRGTLVAQGDRPPSDRVYFPTRFWRAGDTLEGFQISFERQQSVFIGLYDPSTGERVPAFASSGALLPDHALEVTWPSAAP